MHAKQTMMLGMLLLAMGALAADDKGAPAERAGLVTMKGKPVTLQGSGVNVSAVAPEFRVVDAGFKPVKLSDFTGRVVLVSAVPSLDTGVCSLQTKRFNEEAARLPTNVVVLTVSMDLPFAQKRFCSAEKIDRLQVLSDSVWRDFGTKYGLVIKDMGLLARCVLVIGADGRVRYSELVSEIATEPKYDAALKAAREAAEDGGR
jgi:thiol peroxidase